MFFFFRIQVEHLNVIVTLFTLGFKMRLGQSDHKGTARCIVIRSLIPVADVVWDEFDHISFVV